jgi:hypothetical protein
MNIDKMPGKVGMVGGSLLSVVVTFDFSHLLSSLFLAATGTVVSYFVTKALKAIFENEPVP